MAAFASELEESLTEAVAFARGEPSGVVVSAVDVPDVRAIRRQLGLSQQAFAATYRIPLNTVKDWEQGRAQPDAPAAAYLHVISRRPQETIEALAS